MVFSDPIQYNVTTVQDSYENIMLVGKQVLPVVDHNAMMEGYDFTKDINSGKITWLSPIICGDPGNPVHVEIYLFG